MKILVTGDREWNKNGPIKQVLLDLVQVAQDRHEVLEVVHGGAKGADRIAGGHAKAMGCVVHEHPAQWSSYGRAAGPIRNREMLAAHPDVELVVAFHDDLKASKGTKDMVKLAIAHDIDVRLYPLGQALPEKKKSKTPTLF